MLGCLLLSVKALLQSPKQVKILPDPLASEMMPVVRGSLDAAINALASCSRIEERAKRTSGVGPTRVCVTGGQSAAFMGCLVRWCRNAHCKRVTWRSGANPVK